MPNPQRRTEQPIARHLFYLLLVFSGAARAGDWIRDRAVPWAGPFLEFTATAEVVSYQAPEEAVVVADQFASVEV